MTAARSLQLADYDQSVPEQVVTPKPSGGAKVDAPARQVQATIDFKPWIEAKDAAVLLRTDYRHFLKKVRKQLVGRGMAMQSKGPNGTGQLRWFVKRDYDTRLIDGPAGLANRFPDEFYEQSEEKRTKALACAACVRRYRELLTKDSRKRDEWIDRLCEDLSNEYPQLKTIKPRTLYRWHSFYNSDRDIMVFVDKRGGDSTDGHPDPAAWDYFRSLYLHVNSLHVYVCHAMTTDKAEAEGWRWCNYLQAVRRKNKIPLATRVQHRDPERYSAEFSAYLKMDPNTWKPGELWQGDHCVLDQWVRFDGGVIRPWVTAWLDWKSRKIVGWQLSVSPSSATIRTSFLRALQDPENHGGPDIIHIDNGRDYKCEEFTGSKFTKQSVKLKRGYAGMPEFKGLYEHLGFEMIFAIPGNSRGKGRIERWFGTMHGQFDKRNTHSYAGHDADSRPKDLDARLKHERDKVPTFEEVQQRLATYIEHYNYSVEHGKKDMRGASPAQVFSSARKRVMVDPDAIKYFALPHNERTQEIDPSKCQLLNRQTYKTGND